MKLAIMEANQKFIESAGSVTKVFINPIDVFFCLKKQKKHCIPQWLQREKFSS
jgi:hypothetical protein